MVCLNWTRIAENNPCSVSPEARLMIQITISVEAVLIQKSSVISISWTDAQIIALDYFYLNNSPFPDTWNCVPRWPILWNFRIIADLRTICMEPCREQFVCESFVREPLNFVVTPSWSVDLVKFSAIRRPIIIIIIVLYWLCKQGVIRQWFQQKGNAFNRISFGTSETPTFALSPS